MKKCTLQWRLALTTAALVAVACLLLYLFISHSAVMRMDEIEDSIVKIVPDGEEVFEIGLDSFGLPLDFQEQVRRAKSAFLLQSILATLAVILAGGALTYVLAGHALEPLRQLNSHMENIQAQNLSEPLPVPDTGDEIARLTRSFNGMLERLNRSFTMQRQFSANAAHELRTPLAVLQTSLDVFRKRKAPTLEEYSAAVGMAAEQTGRLSQLVSVLLEMTELQTVSLTDRVSLSALAEEVLCDLAQVAEEWEVFLAQENGDAQGYEDAQENEEMQGDKDAQENVSVREDENVQRSVDARENGDVPEDGDVQVTGSDVLLYRAVYNLVENAIKYNRPGGSVTVRTYTEGGRAVLCVRDTGIGIGREHWETIFDPFVRVDKSRSRAMGGAGLGLALVREIAGEHGGSVRVADSSDAGTEIVLELPGERG